MGPADAELAARLVPLATDAGVTLISPATAISPPVDGVFSLIASADAQARAILSAIADGGAESVAIISASDASGLAFDRSARAALADLGVQLASAEQLDAATNPARLAFSVTGSEPDAIILASTSSLAAQNQAVLTALADRGVVGSDLWLTGPALVDYSATLVPGRLEGAQGVRGGASLSDAFALRLRQSDPAVRVTSFAAETYDAVVLAALAAELAGDDSGLSIAAHVREASVDGVPCASFGECVDVLITQTDVNYEGLSGPVSVTEQGSVADGFLSLYRYTAENRADLVGPLVAAGQ
jgi:branched-chain amino acid transport system substrate-binding protein